MNTDLRPICAKEVADALTAVGLHPKQPVASGTIARGWRGFDATQEDATCVRVDYYAGNNAAHGRMIERCATALEDAAFRVLRLTDGRRFLEVVRRGVDGEA